MRCAWLAALALAPLLLACKDRTTAGTSGDPNDQVQLGVWSAAVTPGAGGLGA
ncbi:MAG: hypothetical protein ACI9VR_003618 [Cognaticolwellia sp.]|jgi:hypothetical protein